MWWKEQENYNPKWSLKVGLNCYHLRLGLLNELLLTEEQRKWLEVESAPGEDTVMIAEMTAWRVFQKT